MSMLQHKPRLFKNCLFCLPLAGFNPRAAYVGASKVLHLSTKGKWVVKEVQNVSVMLNKPLANLEFHLPMENPGHLTPEINDSIYIGI